jgi:DNA-directed RNA polymerase specialized sigma24 family protein
MRVCVCVRAPRTRASDRAWNLCECERIHTEVPDEETRLECIRQCLELLPPGNKAVLTRLVGFLKVVAENKV